MTSFLRKPLIGPILIQTLHNISFLGERHSLTHFDCHGTYINEAILQYAINYPNKRIRLFLEATPGSVRHSRLFDKTPENQMDQLAIHCVQGNIAANIEPVYGNVRLLGEVAMLHAIAYPSYFLSAVVRKDEPIEPFMKDMLPKMHMYEQRFLTHIQDRKSLASLVWSLFHPHAQMPLWLQHEASAFGIVGNPLKDILSKLPQEQQDSILTYVRHRLFDDIESQSQLSPALQVAKNLTETGKAFPGRFDPSLNNYLIRILSLFQDVYAVCDILLHYREVDSYICFTGAIHIEEMLAMLQAWVSGTPRYVFSNDGCLDGRDMQKGFFVMPKIRVTDFLVKFLEDHRGF